MIKKSKICDISLVLILCYIAMPFYFAFVTGVWKMIYYLFAVIPLLYFLWIGVKREKGIAVFLMQLFFYVLCVFLVIIVSASFSLDYIIYLFRNFLSGFALVGVFFIWERFYQKQKVAKKFPEIFVQAAILYVIGTIFFIVFPPLKEFWLSMIANFQSEEINDATNLSEYFTRIGFAGFSGFGCALWISVCSIYLSFLYLNNEISVKRAKFYSIFLLLGSFFYGRIGFVTTILCLGLLSLFCLFKGDSKLIRFYLFVVIAFITLGFVLYFSVPDLQNFIEWLIEPILNKINGKGMSSASTDGLLRMYKNFSPTKSELLHGSGFWFDKNDGYYGHTDVGWMRNILYGGVFYAMILYATFFVFLFVFNRIMKQANIKGRQLLIFQIFVMFVVFEMKGDVTFVYITKFLPLYLFVAFEFIKNKRRKICPQLA